MQELQKGHIQQEQNMRLVQFWGHDLRVPGIKNSANRYEDVYVSPEWTTAEVLLDLIQKVKR